MPDTWITDVAAGAGALIAALIVGIAGKKGKEDSRDLPAPHPDVAGVTLGLVEQSVQREMLADTRRTAEACEAIHAMCVEWMRAESARRQADREQTTDHRLDTVESNQSKILDALDRLETREHDEARRR